MDAANSETGLKRILVVDDEENMLKLLQFVLGLAGYEPSCARGGAEAFRLFRERSWNLVITDGAMPGMNGQELARLMRSEKPQVPIILVSGMPDEFRGVALFDAVLAKPFVSTDLLALIQRIINGS